MKIYVHKVRMNPIDGWGKDMGMRIEILGRYADKEKAVIAKNERDKSKDSTYCDIGNSWIEEELIE
jgi:hypothetical protein